jgi:AcrR family transcriptional regulator
MDTSQTSIRDQILAAATPLFVQRGYDGISMREIAEACKLSKAGIYYHFIDKEDLFLALLTANLDHLTGLWSQSANARGNCRARITCFAHMLFEQMGSDERAMIRLANHEMSKLSPARRETFALHYKNTFLAPLALEFQAGIAAGEIKAHDPHLLVWVLLGMLYPFFSPTSETRQEGKADSAIHASKDAVNTVLEIFFDGADV